VEQREVPGGDSSQAIDLVLTTLLHAHISVTNAERQALWQYYSGMLLANAILLGFFAQLQTPTRLQVYFASGFGWALCLAWLVVIVSGWRRFLWRLEMSRTFLWARFNAIDEDANPLNIDFHWPGPRGGWMFAMAVAIIGLFMLAYTFLLAHHLYYMFIFFEGPR
jgi:hypothetical protein